MARKETQKGTETKGVATPETAVAIPATNDWRSAWVRSAVEAIVARDDRQFRITPTVVKRSKPRQAGGSLVFTVFAANGDPVAFKVHVVRPDSVDKLLGAIAEGIKAARIDEATGELITRELTPEELAAHLPIVEVRVDKRWVEVGPDPASKRPLFAVGIKLADGTVHEGWVHEEVHTGHGRQGGRKAINREYA